MSKKKGKKFVYEFDHAIEPSAQCKIGLMYYKEGEIYTFVNDDKIAFEWFTLAAEQGYAEAQYYLGEMYYSGHGVAEDYNAAFKWLTLSAEQGFAKAQVSLGYMYYSGLGVVQNYKTAVKWYTLAAKQGHAIAQHRLDELNQKSNCNL